MFLGTLGEDVILRLGEGAWAELLKKRGTQCLRTHAGAAHEGVRRGAARLARRSETARSLNWARSLPPKPIKAKVKLKLKQGRRPRRWRLQPEIHILENRKYCIIMMMLSNLDAVRVVAIRFDTLVDQVVFLGGATVDLLVTDPGARPARPTRDVDVIVEVASTFHYQASLGPKLRMRGFREDDEPGAPLCRWVVDDVKVDVMPTDARVLGFTNPWYAASIATAVPYALPEGPRIRLISAPCFLATKLAAFRSRGARDLQASVDIEDMVAVLDGRPEVEDEVAAAPPDVRAYVADEPKRLVHEGLGDVLPGHLAGDPADQGRLPRLLGLIERLSGDAEHSILFS